MKLYKYKSLDKVDCVDYVNDILKHNRLYCTKIDELNDPLEGYFILQYLIGEERTFYRDARGVGIHQLKGIWRNFDKFAPEAREIISLIENKRICALSARNNDVVMWSHYANKHNGIAIEIEVPDQDIAFVSNVEQGDQSLFENKRVFEVKYLEELIEVIDGPASRIKDEQAIKVLTTKIIHWEYEREFRIIQENAEHFLLSSRIHKVYCGYKIKSTILEDMKKSFPHIQFIKPSLILKSPWIKF